MFRFLIAATAIALSAGPALANGHGGGDPAPPKPEATTAPAKVVLTKQGPTLVDLKGMTLYTYERDTTGKTSNCNGKCTESWVPLSATVDAKRHRRLHRDQSQRRQQDVGVPLSSALHLAGRQGARRCQRQCHDAAMARRPA